MTALFLSFWTAVQSSGGFYDKDNTVRGIYPMGEADVLFESCASGGARFDPGMLHYAPQAWTSDDTDAVERDRKSTRLNSSHSRASRMPSSA